MNVKLQMMRIGDLCEVIAGQSPEGTFYNADAKGMPFYQGKKDFGEKFIGAPKTWTTQTTKVARAGDILMSVRAPVGPVNLAIGEACIGRGLAAIRSGTELDRDFLFYQLLHLQPEIAGKEGAVFASINKSEIEGLPIVFAPLPEQKRIVTTLDAAFAAIATARANAEQNLRNSSDLFAALLNRVFSQRGDGWADKRFGAACSFVRGPFGGSLTKPMFVDDGYAVYEQSHAIANQFSDVRYFIDEKKFSEMCRFEVQPNDIVMSCAGTMGRTAIVPEGVRPGIINQALLKLTPGSDVLARFLKYWMESENFQDALQANAAGAAIQNVASVKILKDIRVPVPPLAEQHRVVRILEQAGSATHRLEAITRKKLAVLDELKWSLLDQAFAGAL